MKLKVIYGSKYKDLLKENKQLKKMIQRDRYEVLKEMETINNKYLTELFIQQNKINKAIEYIKEHIRIDDEYPDYMEMLIEERDYLLEILGDKENIEKPIFTSRNAYFEEIKN